MIRALSLVLIFLSAVVSAQQPFGGFGLPYYGAPIGLPGAPQIPLGAAGSLATGWIAAGNNATATGELPSAKGRETQVEYDRHGKPHGQWVWYHDNFRPACCAFFHHGQRVGTWRWWHENGRPRVEGVYEDDKPAEVWTYWNSDGEIESVDDYGETPAHSVPAKKPAKPGRHFSF